ncbi:MAG: hypothetical protein JWM10_4726 [Myxococcaceae bacterium]|nr:hypothetical protein [Myxococcaceae bacterium]
MSRRSPLGLALGVTAAVLLTHVRTGRADCAYEAETFTLELERVTVDGQVVADTTPWRRSTMEVWSNYPGEAGLTATTIGGNATGATLRPQP